VRRRRRRRLSRRRHLRWKRCVRLSWCSMLLTHLLFFVVVTPAVRKAAESTMCVVCDTPCNLQCALHVLLLVKRAKCVNTVM
jgi:hypothetical protein